MAGGISRKGPTVSGHEKADSAKTCVKRKATRSKQKMSDVSFPFLELPAEMRNTIYQYALIDPEHVISLQVKGQTVGRRLATKADYIDLWRCGNVPLLPIGDFPALNSSLPWKWKLNNRLSYQLLQVCKQIHSEAAPMFYAKNHFLFIDSMAMNRFLRKCDRQIQHIRHITLLQLYREGGPAFKSLIGAVNLESFMLKQSCYDFLIPRTWDRVTPSRGLVIGDFFYRIAEPWLWFFAGRSGNKAHALDLLYFSNSSRKPPLQSRTQDVQVFKKFKDQFEYSLNKTDSDGFERNFRKGIQQCMD